MGSLSLSAEWVLPSAEMLLGSGSRKGHLGKGGGAGGIGSVPLSCEGHESLVLARQPRSCPSRSYCY